MQGDDAERYPKLYEDNEAIKLTDKLGIEHKKRNARYTFYDEDSHDGEAGRCGRESSKLHK